jgi:uncharacterized protein (DUF302 family)
MADDGLITLRSSNDFATTLARFLEFLADKRVTIFAQIDHAAGAAAAGLALPPTTLVIFGNPTTGTPLMQVAQIAGIDLPLKALVWQAADGTVNLTYNAPAWIANRHGIGSTLDHAVEDDHSHNGPRTARNQRLAPRPDA